MRLTNSARQEAGLFQNIQTVPLCWNGAESLLAVAAGSRGHLTASPAMVTGAVAEMPSTLPPAVRGIGPHLVLLEQIELAVSTTIHAGCARCDVAQLAA